MADVDRGALLKGSPWLGTPAWAGLCGWKHEKEVQLRQACKSRRQGVFSDLRGSLTTSVFSSPWASGSPLALQLGLWGSEPRCPPNIVSRMNNSLPHTSNALFKTRVFMLSKPTKYI